jgi:hypothetical protein
VLARCLEPEPAGRWQSAGDLKAALELALAAGVARSPARMRASMPPRLRLSMPGRRSALIAGIVAACLAVGYFASPFRPLAPQRIQIGPPAGAVIARISVSPDGQKVAFTTGAGRLWVRDLGWPEAREIPGVDGSGSPFWSPDSKWVAFVSRGELKKAPLSGGPPQTLARVNTNLGGTWSAAGGILIGQVGDGLYRVHPNGGAPVRATEPDRARGEVRHIAPQFLPDGRRFLYIAATQRGAHTLYASSVAGGEAVRIAEVESNVAYADGHLLFSAGRRLMAQEFDVDRLRQTGEPFEIGGPVLATPAVGSTLVIAQFSAARKTLAYFGAPGGPTPMGNLTPAAFSANGPAITVLRNWAR